MKEKPEIASSIEGAYKILELLSQNPDVLEFVSTLIYLIAAVIAFFISFNFVQLFFKFKQKKREDELYRLVGDVNKTLGKIEGLVDAFNKYILQQRTP